MEEDENGVEIGVGAGCWVLVGCWWEESVLRPLSASQCGTVAHFSCNSRRSLSKRYGVMSDCILTLRSLTISPPDGSHELIPVTVA